MNFELFPTKQILNLSKSAVYDGLNGRVANLIANDMGRFEQCFPYLHDTWKAPLETILFGYFIYQQIGVAGIFGIAFSLFFVPIQGIMLILPIAQCKFGINVTYFISLVCIVYVSRKSAKLHRTTAERTDFRVKIMNEIILGIQGMKLSI